jgi:hypothetical protein
VKLQAIVKAKCTRYIERTGDISLLLRYFVTMPDAGMEGASPPEKFYSFFLKDLAGATSRNHHSRPGDCVLLTDNLIFIDRDSR